MTTIIYCGDEKAAPAAVHEITVGGDSDTKRVVNPRKFSGDVEPNATRVVCVNVDEDQVDAIRDAYAGSAKNDIKDVDVIEIDVESPEPEAPKSKGKPRKRRTKAEMAADAKAKKAAEVADGFTNGKEPEGDDDA